MEHKRGTESNVFHSLDGTFLKRKSSFLCVKRDLEKGIGFFCKDAFFLRVK